MIFYAVIDTNVVVSSFIKEDSIPNKIINMALDGPIIPLLNDEILREYREVLIRNEFGLTEEVVERFVSGLEKKAIFLDRSQTDETFTDSDDVVFYEIVLTAREVEMAYLITGNKKHFPSKPFVVTPREMLEIINKEANKNAPESN